LLGSCLDESFSVVLSAGTGDCVFAAGGCLANAALAGSFVTTLSAGDGDSPCATGKSWTLVGTVLEPLFVGGGAGAFAAGVSLAAVLGVCLGDESFLTALLAAAEDGPFAAGGSLLAMLVGCFMDESSLTALFAGAGDGRFAVGGCSSLVGDALVGFFLLGVGAGVVLGAEVEVGASAGVFVGSGMVVGAGVTCVVVGGAVVPPAHAGIFGTPM